MRLSEISPGEKALVASNRIASFIKLVKTECSDAWDAYHRTNKLLCRGVKNAHNISMFHGLTRNSRNPMSTSRGEQDHIDMALKKYGFTALRSNSIYCTADEGDAKSYGELFIIFPKNGFDFTWSPVIGDLYLDMRRSGIANATTMSYEEIIEQFQFRKDRFDEALDSYHEILIKGEYYACSWYKYDEYIKAKMV